METLYYPTDGSFAVREATMNAKDNNDQACAHIVTALWA